MPMEEHSHGISAAQAAIDTRLRQRLMLAFFLVFAIFLAQGIGALISGSLALLVDMFHALVDSTGLLVALVTAVMMSRPANKHRTWGFRRLEVISALLQAALLAFVAIYAAIEAIDRWNHPPTVDPHQLLIFGCIALTLNLLAAYVMHADRAANFNMKAAFLEVAMDALGTLSVIVSAIIGITTGFTRVDAAAALFIALLMAPRALLLMRDTLRVLMEFTPAELDLDEVREHLLALEHVTGVHDLHASTVATGLPQISGHIQVNEQCFHDGCAPDVLAQAQQCVAEHFPVQINHATFQLEPNNFTSCQHNPELHV